MTGPAHLTGQCPSERGWPETSAFSGPGRDHALRRVAEGAVSREAGVFLDNGKPAPALSVPDPVFGATQTLAGRRSSRPPPAVENRAAPGGQSGPVS
ncbi:MAG: hypothetical protein ACRDTC_18820 [Pseudonocardiaceae bacterium]